MIPRKTVSIKKICLWSLIVFIGILVVCLLFVSLVSLWAGFAYMQKDGFWVPLLAGTLLLIATLLLFIRVAKGIFSHMKDEDVLNT